MTLMTVFSALGLARFGYTMLLPPMQEGLGLSNTEAGALATGNFIGYLSLALVGGFLASHFGPRRVVTISLFVVGVTMMLTATADSFFTALLWRTLTGLGSGGSNVPVMGLVVAWFAIRRRGLATGIAVTGSSFGLILTGNLVPIILNITGDSGWRYGWFVLGVLVVAVGVLALIFLRNAPSDKGLSPVGEVETKPPSSAEPPEHGSRKKPTFASWGLIYKSRTVWHLALIYTTFGFSYIIYATFFAKYLESELGYTRAEAGNLWQIVGWISISCGIFWGWVSDMLGRKYGLALVSALQGTAYVLFAVWTAPLGAVISAVIFGLTAWSIPAIMAAACGDRLGSRLAPAALGFVTLFFGIGQAMGPTVGGGIADLTGSFATSFLVAMAIAWTGTRAALALPRAQS